MEPAHDEYGGPIENRARFLCEVVTEAKSRTGGDFPVWVRLDALEYRTPDGITFDECEITARLAVEAGADAIHLSAYGDMTSGQAFTDGMILDQEAKHSALSGRLTEALPVPVIAVGRIRPSTGDQMIGHGKTDIVAMGRQMLADPETGRKVRENRVEEIRPCINCYVCVAQPFFDRRVKCAVNPVLARESELGAVESTPAETPKKIVVVGGGPAGLEVARVAPCEGTTSPSSKRRATSAERCVRGAALRTQPSAAQVVRARDAAPGGRRPHRHDRNPRGGCCALARSCRRGYRGGPHALDAARADRSHVFDGDDLRELLTGAGATGAKKLPLPARLALGIGRRVGLIDDPGILAKLTEQYMPVGKRW